MVGVGAGYAATLSLPVVQILMFAVYMFGLVNISWLIVGTSCAALYGWKKNNKLFNNYGCVYYITFYIISSSR